MITAKEARKMTMEAQRRQAYAMYYATRILEDPCREEIMCEIERTEARQQSVH